MTDIYILETIGPFTKADLELIDTLADQHGIDRKAFLTDYIKSCLAFQQDVDKIGTMTPDEWGNYILAKGRDGS